MKILIERERKTENRRERERETETERKKRRVSVRVRVRERKNLTYCSSADPTTFRVLLISREKEAERQRASISELSVCPMCQKLYDG